MDRRGGRVRSCRSRSGSRFGRCRRSPPCPLPEGLSSALVALNETAGLVGTLTDVDGAEVFGPEDLRPARDRGARAGFAAGVRAVRDRVRQGSRCALGRCRNRGDGCLPEARRDAVDRATRQLRSRAVCREGPASSSGHRPGRKGLNYGTHFALGTRWGSAYAVAAWAGLRGPRAVAAVFGVVRTGDVLLNTALGLYQPSTWSRRDWAVNVVDKLVQAAATAVVYDQVLARD